MVRADHQHRFASVLRRLQGRVHAAQQEVHKVLGGNLQAACRQRGLHALHRKHLLGSRRDVLQVRSLHAAAAGASARIWNAVRCIIVTVTGPN